MRETYNDYNTTFRMAVNIIEDVFRPFSAFKSRIAYHSQYKEFSNKKSLVEHFFLLRTTKAILSHSMSFVYCTRNSSPSDPH